MYGALEIDDDRYMYMWSWHAKHQKSSCQCLCSVVSFGGLFLSIISGIRFEINTVSQTGKMVQWCSVLVRDYWWHLKVVARHLSAIEAETFIKDDICQGETLRGQVCPHFG